MLVCVFPTFSLRLSWLANALTCRTHENELMTKRRGLHEPSRSAPGYISANRRRKRCEIGGWRQQNPVGLRDSWIGIRMSWFSTQHVGIGLVGMIWSTEGLLWRSLDGGMVSKALLKSNMRRKVSTFLSIPIRMSSVSLRSAVWVLWNFWKPVFKVLIREPSSRKPTILSWANFSNTLERKKSSAIDLKSEEVDGTDAFWAKSFALFQDAWKTLRAKDALNCPTQTITNVR